MNHVQTDLDAGLWKRGLLLFVAVAGIAAIVLFILLQRLETGVGVDQPAQPGSLTAVLPVPGAPFPGTLAWGPLYQVGQDLPSPRGWAIRYNATLVLARRGSVHTPLPVLVEMLDERRQKNNFRTQNQNGEWVTDEAAAHRTVLNALQAFVDWHRHPETVNQFGPDRAELQEVYAVIDRLAQSPNPVLRTAAEKARQAVGRS